MKRNGLETTGLAQPHLPMEKVHTQKTLTLGVTPSSEREKTPQSHGLGYRPGVTASVGNRFLGVGPLRCMSEAPLGNPGLGRGGKLSLNIITKSQPNWGNDVEARALSSATQIGLSPQGQNKPRACEMEKGSQREQSTCRAPDPVLSVGGDTEARKGRRRQGKT